MEKPLAYAVNCIQFSIWLNLFAFTAADDDNTFSSNHSTEGHTWPTSPLFELYNFQLKPRFFASFSQMVRFCWMWPSLCLSRGSNYIDRGGVDFFVLFGWRSDHESVHVTFVRTHGTHTSKWLAYLMNQWNNAWMHHSSVCCMRSDI